MAIIAALLKRKRTAKPSTIETPIWKSGVVTVGPAFLDLQANKRLPRRMGNRDTYASPHNVYPCKGEDRWCAISVPTEKEWEAFCGVLGNPPWTKDGKFSTLLDRKKNEDELDDLIGKWTINYEAEEVMGKMQEAGVPAGVVAKGQDLYESPQLRARDFYQETEYYIPDFLKPGIEWETAPQTTLVGRVPIGLSETPTEVGRYGRVGEDNEYIYKEIISISEEEIKRLTEIGAIR
jgi:benzylsuccinate CoA-transferase BbsF subunit